MKTIKYILLTACLTSTLSAQAQTNPAAPAQAAAIGVDNPAQAAARLALLQKLNQAPADPDTNGTATLTANPAPTSAAGTNSADMPMTNAVNDTSPSAAMPLASNAAVEPAGATTAANDSARTAVPAPAPNKPADIPLIQFSDVPLTTAIENLARQAGINYMLDPKIAYGQPDQSGQVKAEPTLSIRWENITAENALLALLDNYGLQLIRDNSTRIGRITTKDPTAPPPLETRVLQLKFSSVSNMLDAVQSTLTDKRSRVIADVRTSQLVVVATEVEQQAVDVLAEKLDTPTKQVLIETKLVEISSNPTSQKGVDWTSTLQAQHVSFGNNSSYLIAPTVGSSEPNGIQSIGGVNTVNPSEAYAGVPSGILQSPGVISSTTGGFGPEGFLDADGLSVVLSFLNSSSDAQIVSTPRVVTLDNETATISVTRGYPVFNVTASTQNTSGGSSVSYTNIGTVLSVTPRISANDQIWLKINPKVSSYGGLESLTVDGSTYEAYLFDNRAFETEVVIPNAHTLVMGGLVQDNPISTSTKVPLLGDIPGMGYLFRWESKSTTKDNLLIFITPTIVKDDDFQASDTDFFKSRATKRPVMIDPNNLWDGTRPYNWSSPTNTDPAQAIIDERSVQ